MSLTIAQLNSAVFVGLGKPDKGLCDLDDIHYAARRVVSLLTRRTRSSDNNQIVSVTDPFQPNVSPFEITNLLNGGTPAWLETEVNDRWKVIRVINKAFLETMYERNIMAASFYGLEDKRQFIDFSYPLTSDSVSSYRIWYDKDLVAYGNADELLMPDSFAPYYELRIMQALIPKITLKLAEMNETPAKMQAQANAWKNIFTANALELVDWEREFRIWKNRNRTAQTQSRLPAKSGKAFYGR
jgi:hypothetical protein